MRLSISNIAWEIADDEAIAELLRQHQINAIDVAPGKYFPEPAKATASQIALVKDWWAARGIDIIGMQALLFGTSGLSVFGPPASQDAMLSHLDGVCRIGAGLGANKLVFGSPKNRDRGTLDDGAAMAIAVPFFRRLGDIAATHGVTICLEPNPPCYGTNFMTTSAETARVVEAVNHASIRMQFDTGALQINGENPQDVLASCAGLIGHIHASEPNLLPLGDDKTDHASMAAALKKFLPEQVITIEMVATKDERHLTSISRALFMAVRHYRDGNGAGA